MKIACGTLLVVLLLAGTSVTVARAGESEGNGCHWQVSVAPTPAASKDSHAPIVTTMLVHRLLKAGWEVVATGNAASSKESLGANDEQMAALAMSGVDVLVTFGYDVTQDGNGLSVTMRLNARAPLSPNRLAHFGAAEQGQTPDNIAKRLRFRKMSITVWDTKKKWRRRESNPRPKMLDPGPLHA